MKLKVLDLKLISKGNFLSFYKRDYLDKDNNKKVYEFIERNNDQKAVIIIAQEKEKILLIKQFRVPVLNYVIEFPAGLIEKNESIEECVHREFIEETGYRCDIIEISPPTATSAGLTTEKVYFVKVEIKEYIGENQESSEDIEVLWVDDSNWQEIKKENVIINGWVYSYMEGKFTNK